MAGAATAGPAGGGPTTGTPDIITAGQAGTLAAAAQAGSAGVKAYNDAQSANDTAQKNAVAEATARASLIGGPESQGFQNIANQQYTTNGNNLASALGTFKANMAANQNANSQYFDQVRAGQAVNDSNTAKLLAAYDAQKAATAPFPTAKIIGATELGLPAAQKAASDATAAIPVAQKQVDDQKFSGESNLAPIASKMNGNFKTIAGLNHQLANGAAMLPATKQKITAQRDFLVNQNNTMNAALEKQRGIEQGKVDAARGNVTTTQNTANTATQAADPVNYARNIAAQLGLDPVMAAGYLNNHTLGPTISADNNAVSAAQGQQAVGIANKLNINGGATRVSQILSSPVAQQWISDAGQKASQYTWLQARTNLANDFKGQPDAYQVMVDQLKDYPWKKK